MQLREAEDQAEIQNCGTDRHDVSEVTVVVSETLSEQGEESKKTERCNTIKMILMPYIIERRSKRYTCLTFSNLEDKRIVAKNMALRLTGEPTMFRVMLSKTTGLLTAA